MKTSGMNDRLISMQGPFLIISLWINIHYFLEHCYIFYTFTLLKLNHK